MKEFKKPDLNAPRFRPRKQNILNNKFYDRFRAKYPKHADLTNEQIKQTIVSFNGSIWQTIINDRDGVELPEQLGYVFIGTCPKKVRDNPNYGKSIQYGFKIQNTNWESDQYVAKIFYTNYENKYSFKFHELWGFTGVRDFKRTVAKTYPGLWKQYIAVDGLHKISKLFRKENYKEHLKKEQEQKIDLSSYDEFDLS
jgi:hypothetical protein